MQSRSARRMQAAAKIKNQKYRVPLPQLGNTIRSQYSTPAVKMQAKNGSWMRGFSAKGRRIPRNYTQIFCRICGRSLPDGLDFTNGKCYNSHKPKGGGRDIPGAIWGEFDYMHAQMHKHIYFKEDNLKMNKKMSKALAVALSAAMAASAFAIGTGSAFAAVTPTSAKATLAAAKSIPEYLWNDNKPETPTTDDNTVDKIEVNLTDAYDLANLLDDATLTLNDGSTVKLGDVNANYSKVTFNSDSDIVTLDNGKISAVADATGTAQITISGLTVQKDDTTYAVAPITLDVNVIAPNDYSEGVWSKDGAKTLTNEVSVGDTVSLYEAKASNVQTPGAFAKFAYTQLKPDNDTPRQGRFDESDAKNFDSLKLKGNQFNAIAAGSGTIDYYPSNAAVKGENPEAKASQELTVKGVYTNVSNITKKDDGTYNVKVGTQTVNLTADELANGTFELASTVKSIANSDSTQAADIKIDTKLGTVKATTTATLGLYGVEIDTVSATHDVNVYSAVNAKTNAYIPATVGTVETDARVQVGGNENYPNGTPNYNTITVDTIKANTVSVNTNKAEIGAITKKNEKASASVTTTTAGVKLPALDGYTLTTAGNATVASIANAPSASIKGTLTVSGTAEFEGPVTGGTISIGAADLTIAGATSDSFTLDLTSGVQAGATAFKTSNKLEKNTNYTQKSTTETGLGALINIKTPGYTAVADGNYNAIIDQTIVAGGIQDATSGAVYNEKTGCYDLEISDGEVATLALQPKNVDSLDKTQSITWTLRGADNMSAATDNWMMGGVYSDGKTVSQARGGLTQTVSADYVRNYSNSNTAYVTATLQGSKPIVYCIKVVNEKTTQTTGFSLTASANYVQPGDEMTIYATPNGTQNLKDVKFSSSDTSVATVTSGTQGKSNWSATVAGVKDGTATITVVGTVADGTQVTQTIDVTVTSTPVLAYVDGKLVGPTDMIDVAQSTSKDVTFFSANGKTIDSFNYVTGNGKVIGTNTLNVWNGTSGAYQVYAAGKVGEATGIYVNNQKVFMAKVTDRPFTSDTTMNVNLPVGKTYSFKISLKDKSAPFTFSTANGTALSTSYNKAYYPDANGDYICTIKAEKAVGGVGVYVNIAGVNYKVFTAVTQ